MTKAQRREVRRLAGVVYERELAAALGQLESAFGRWHRGEIDAFALNDEIHRFHDGASKDLWKQYALGEAGFGLAAAIARGILKETEVNTAILKNLGGLIAFARENGEGSDE